MPNIEIKNFDSPDEVRPFEGKGQAEVVKVGGQVVGRATFEPGWKWSDNVKPIAGTDSCQTLHTGICLSGQIQLSSTAGRNSRSVLATSSSS
ncbi:MAG: hypothetical protein M3R49_12725, partial [Chloroflexota bacterium]|nr:hypothetical protein [Chloroflexota bacterium]